MIRDKTTKPNIDLDGHRCEKEPNEMKRERN